MDTDLQDDLVGMMIENRFLIEDPIGTGSCATVYNGRDARSGKKLAIKVESIAHQSAGDFGGLQLENNIYEGVKRAGYGNEHGFATVHYFGEFGEDYRVLVMDCLGNDLEAHLIWNDQNISLQEVLLFGVYALRSIQCLHKVGFVHRDIKPGNLMLGLDNKCPIFLADFGLAKRFWMKELHTHILITEGGSSFGTPDFASKNMENGIEPSRRDDLECLLFTLIYLFKGDLPWSVTSECISSVDSDGSLNSEDDSLMDVDDGLKDRKLRALQEPETLVSGMPIELLHFYNHVSLLEFQEEPNYTLLGSLLGTALRKCQK